MNKYLEKIAEQDNSESHPLRNTASALGLGAVAALEGALGGEMLGKKLLPHVAAAQPRMSYREAKRYMGYYGRSDTFEQLRKAKNMRVPPMPREYEEGSYNHFYPPKAVKEYEDALYRKEDQIDAAKSRLFHARLDAHGRRFDKVHNDQRRFIDNVTTAGGGVAGTAGMVGGYRLSHGPFGDKESQ